MRATRFLAMWENDEFRFCCRGHRERRRSLAGSAKVLSRSAVRRVETGTADVLGWLDRISSPNSKKG